ncbi:unnamed protein product [Agarophyton chilense]|eukprot:gb/GEZJ01003600.1/.p1 GENE.gb/GEZJ01003600.1/~~gb/GEZJ01003600.1/.p1  ORF type:complete len:148 (-),score=24.12 gb/GEZJ01003600.1/:1220-1663(-)
MGKKGGKGAGSSSGGGKGKGQAGPSNASKGGKAGGKGGKGGKEDMKNCNHVKARHILCEKYGKIDEAYTELKEKYPGKIPPAKFGEIAKKYSECSSANSGGNLGWFPRGKMVGAFEEKAFNTAPGEVTAPFKSSAGYHIVLVEGRKM